MRTKGSTGLTEVAQFRLGQNAGFGAPGGVQPIGSGTAFPTFGDHVLHGIVGIHLDISGHTGQDAILMPNSSRRCAGHTHLGFLPR